MLWGQPVRLVSYDQVPSSGLGKKSYARRPTVEAVIGKIKANSGLGNAACQALGPAPPKLAGPEAGLWLGE